MYSGLNLLKKHQQFMQDYCKTNIKLLCVGGCVRDIVFLGKETVHDIDLTGAFVPEDIYPNIQQGDLSTFKTDKYGTISVVDKKHSVNYELTPFRIESGYTDKRRPDNISRSKNIIDDASRRDFTCNAMYYSGYAYTSKHTDIEHQYKNTDRSYDMENKLLRLYDHDLIASLFSTEFNDKKIRQFAEHNKIGDIEHIIMDPFGGSRDMYNGKFTCVGDPQKRIQEDALRIIRALRFIVTLNKQGCRLDFDKATWQALQIHFHLVRTLPKERIHNELQKVLVQGCLFSFVVLADKINILRTLFPSVALCKNIEQPVRYHPFDVYNHTLLCIRALEAKQYTPNMLMAMLFHDVGKVDQYHMYNIAQDITQIHKIAEMNHRNTSSKIADIDLMNLGFNKKDREEIAWYIDNHHSIDDVFATQNEEKRKKKLRVILAGGGEKQCMHLIDIIASDREGQVNPIQLLDHRELDTIKQMFKDLIIEEGTLTMKELAITGNRLINQYGLEPGPTIGKLLEISYNRVLGNPQKRNTIEELSVFTKGWIVKNINL